MTDGASSSAKKAIFSPAPPAPRNEVVAPFAPGSCPNDPFRTEKSKTRHQLSVPEKHRKKDYGEKKARYPLMPTFSVASSRLQHPLLCHNNPHCFCVCVLLEPGKFLELKNLISHVGMGKMQVCF